ncbi:MAG: hypothetical protein AAGF84_15050, partial [Planctomycetota bacterium]
MSIRPEDIPEEQEMTAVREAATSPKRKRRAGGRRLLRWSVRLAVGGGLLLVLLVALLPTLVSTNAGTSRIVGAINERVPGQIEIDDLKLAWLKGLSLEGVRLYDPAGEVVGSLDAVRLEEVGLFGLLRGTRDLGIVAIEGGALSLVEDEEGQTNLDRALGTRLLGEPEGNDVEAKPTNDSPRESRPTSPPQERDDPAWVPADLRLAFAMRDIKVSVVGPSLPDVRIDMPEATLTADGPAKLGFTLEATVAQGEDDGQVKIAGTVDRLFDDAGRPSWPDARFDVEGLVEHVPLAAFDRLFPNAPSLETLIGPTLDAQVSLQGPATGLDALVIVSSQHLDIRQGLVADAQGIAASDESQSTWVVTPASWALLTGGDSEGPALVDSFVLAFGLTGLDAPRQGQGIDLTRTQFMASLRLDVGQVIRLDVPDQGEIAVREFKAALGSASAAAGVSFTLDADLDAYGSRGELSGVVDVRRGEAGWKALEIESVLRSLPMPVMDALAGQGRRLTATFGPTVGVNLLARADGSGGYALTAGFDPGAGSPGVPQLSGTMTGRYTADGAVALRTDTPLVLTLTPEAFAAWMTPLAEVADMGESVGLSLPEPTQVEANLDFEFALADGPGLRFVPDRTRAMAVIDLPETRLVDEWYHRDVPIRNGQVRIDAPDLRQPITATLGFETEAASGETGQFEAGILMTGAMLDDGYVQIESGQISGEIELNRVPTVVFDALSRQRGYAVAAFGETVSADIEPSDWSFGNGGRFELELSSANNSMGSLSGEDRDGYFEPDAPMTFFLNQTPELSNKILRFLNPVLLPAVVSATVPIAVTIDDDTLRLPTRAFDIGKLDADIQVQMGTLSIVPNVSPVDKILPQLQTLGLIERASIYEARVSPITLRIRNGVIIYEDLSFKIDDVELSFGGTISLVDQTVDMGMTLGGREIERDPLLQRLVGDGITIGGTVQEPQVNLASVLNAFSQERLPQTLGGILEGVLRKERGRDREPPQPAQPDSETPNAT